jgi:hypothetical protein
VFLLWRDTRKVLDKSPNFLLLFLFFFYSLPRQIGPGESWFSLDVDSKSFSQPLGTLSFEGTQKDESTTAYILAVGAKPVDGWERGCSCISLASRFSCLE